MPKRARRELMRVCLQRRRTLQWLMLPAAGIVATPLLANTSRIASTRVWPSQEYTRVIFEGPGPIPHRMTLLKSPERLVLDFDDTELTTPLAKLATQVDANDPFISAVRFGRPVFATLRIVFDLRGEVNPQIFELPPVAEFAHRLVLDLYPTRPVDPLMALLERDAVAVAPRSPPPAPGDVTRVAPRQKPVRGIVVAIDPGHGGEDPGAVGPRGTYEKHVTLAIARRLKRVVEAQPNVRAMLTRDDDYFVPLALRVAKARRVQADLFVSIHADAFREQRARGSSVFALSETGATSAAARWLAQKENQADLIGGVNLDVRDPVLARTLLHLSQSAQINDSLKVGRHVLSEIGEHNVLHKPAVEQAGFAVLKAPDIPSILIETAFISNPEEELKLRSDRHQQRFAESIGEGIRRYFAGNPPLARS
ncbi:MAG TPA: N-acetylmuramoyl-L-alanine amidase [Casimicrobiaceae bacterium]|nr:N-acetylmuramoyl-L-alanine amidase [Casimicrobiaceae bacterium]